MMKIVLDAGAVAKLGEVDQAAEICDASGRVVGFFTPTIDPSDWEIVNPPTREELEAAGKDLRGRPLVEIMKDLERPQ